MEMRDGRLDAQINAGNAVTRDLRDLPRLRDALQQNGINQRSCKLDQTLARKCSRPAGQRRAAG